MIMQANKEDFREKVLDNPKTVIVDFYADWCGPCKMLGPVLEDLAKKHAEIDVVKVNCDTNRELAMQYSVRNIPAIFVFKQGKIVNSALGFLDYDALMELL